MTPDSILERLEKLHKGTRQVPKIGRVLYVDDDKILRNELREVTEKNFNYFDVVLADSGEQGIEIVDKYKGEFCFIGMDVIMPGMNGFEAFEKIHRKYPDIPVAMITAYHGQKKTLLDITSTHGLAGYIVKSPDGGFVADLTELLVKITDLTRQRRDDNDFKKLIRNGLQSLEDLLLVETVVGGKAVAIPFDNNYLTTTLVRPFAGPKDLRASPEGVIGAFVDAEEWMVDLAIEEAKKSALYWHDEDKISKTTYLKIMERFGEILQDNRVKVNGKVRDFDLAMCHSNLAAYDIIKRDRVTAGLFARKTAKYNEWALRHRTEGQELTDDVKTVAAFIQSSMYQTGSYGIIDTLRARKSLIIKLDSEDPFTQHQVCKAFVQAWDELKEEGLIDKSYNAPLQILAWNTDKHLDRGGKVIKETDATIFMGNPKKAVLIEHGLELRGIKLRTEDQFVELSRILREKTINDKVVYYTANKGFGFLSGIKSIESLNDYVDQIVHSCRSHYRSCKRLITSVIDTDWHPDTPEELKQLDFYETALGLIRKKFSELPIGWTGDKDAKVVRVNSPYWAKIARYLTQAKEYGNVIRVTDDDRAPAIIILDPEKVAQNYKEISNYLSSECMYPVLNVVKGGANTAKDVLRLMCIRGDPKNLETTIWTDDENTYKGFIEHNQIPKFLDSGDDMMRTQTHSYGLYLNEPTTNGLGTFAKLGEEKPLENPKFRGHQFKIAYLELRTMKK